MIAYPTYADELDASAASDSAKAEAVDGPLREPWFDPLEWQQSALADESFVLLLTGAAGGGKSVCAAQKMHDFMMRYPGSVGAAGRFHRANAKKSCAMALQKAQGGVGKVKYNKTEGIFTYPNGAIIYIFGVKDETQLQAIRSINGDGSLDIVWFEEANAFSEEAYTEFRIRLRATNGDYRQLILSTNPDSPLHWIKTRLIDGGEASVHVSSYRDNPHNADDYTKNIESTRGLRRKRLVDGLWSYASGLTYHQWHSEKNVSVDADFVPGAGPVVWGIDDGFTGSINPGTGYYNPNSHPRVFLMGQIRAGILYIFFEHHEVQTLREDHVPRVLDARHTDNRKFPRPAWVACESAPELKKNIEKWVTGNIFNKPTSVKDSTDTLNEYLGETDNGVRRVVVHPRCKHLAMEMVTNQAKPDGTPTKDFDNFLDALRYLVWRFRDQRG